MRAFVLLGCAILLSVGAVIACSTSSSEAPTETADGSTGPAPGDDAAADAGGEVKDASPTVATKDMGSAFCLKTFGSMISSTDACCSAEERATSYHRQLFANYGDVQAACSKTLEGSIAKGRISYNQEAASACIAAFDAAAKTTCGKELFFALDLMTTASCRAAIGGLQPAGAVCAVDYECQDGLTCFGDSTKPEGVCTAPPAVGGKCGIPKSPDATNFKLGSHRMCPLGSDCRRGICTAATAGFECDLDSDCADDKKCVLGKCATSRGQAGAQCERRDDCDLAVYCDRAGDDAGIGTCTARNTAGATCNPSFPGGPQCKGRCTKVDGGGGTSSCSSFCGTN